MANVVYNGFKYAIGVDLSLANDTFYVMLVTDTYVPDEDTHITRANIDALSGAEVVGTGYTAGGKQLLNTEVAVDLINNRSYFTADTLVWTSTVLTAKGAIIYKNTGNSATDILVTYVDFNENKTSMGGNFAIEWDATGILRIQ